ncbi:unnamed protein product [Tetraodon nigroviridis]|uniref:(spotted green pufferfish) hypothetical protein n=1 Tax=Tetraodon nigroviridis TaxID=99883 RepID=Q4T764_TETNG|nr:unnamed protein product [Tetraodon nigroviridis]
MLNTSLDLVRSSFPVNRNIPPREFLRLDGGTGCRKQMLVLEQLQHVRRTSDPLKRL